MRTRGRDEVRLRRVVSGCLTMVDACWDAMQNYIGNLEEGVLVLDGDKLEKPAACGDGQLPER